MPYKKKLYILLIPVIVCGTVVHIEISKGSNTHLCNLGQFSRAINNNSLVLII